MGGIPGVSADFRSPEYIQFTKEWNSTLKKLMKEDASAISARVSNSKKSFLTVKEFRQLEKTFLSSPEVQVDRQFDRKGHLGLCYGRAFAAHLMANLAGVDSSAIRKIVVTGNLINKVSRQEWQYHVATMVRVKAEKHGTESFDWYVLDSLWGADVGLLPAERWISKIEEGYGESGNLVYLVHNPFRYESSNASFYHPSKLGYKMETAKMTDQQLLREFEKQRFAKFSKLAEVHPEAKLGEVLQAAKEEALLDSSLYEQFFRLQNDKIYLALKNSGMSATNLDAIWNFFPTKTTLSIFDLEAQHLAQFKLLSIEFPNMGLDTLALNIRQDNKLVFYAFEHYQSFFQDQYAQALHLMTTNGVPRATAEIRLAVLTNNIRSTYGGAVTDPNNLVVVPDFTPAVLRKFLEMEEARIGYYSFVVESYKKRVAQKDASWIEGVKRFFGFGK